MQILKGMIWGAVLLAAPFSLAEGAGYPLLPEAARAADVLFLGENHDNPAHHERQADWVAVLKPGALVFEMLTQAQEARITPDLLEDKAALEAAVGWEAAGWPDFDMYYPIFAAAQDARIVAAAVPRETLGALMAGDLAAVAGPELTARFKLDTPLSLEDQVAREALQQAAHCNALPSELLPRMVQVQRLRDAALAQAALDGLEMTGGPVVVITGNGHARTDWGAPALLRAAAPEVKVFALVQSEDGAMPDGTFDHAFDAPAVDRGDPCDAFK
jgi:uncharacterized iron-regulated protein